MSFSPREYETLLGGSVTFVSASRRDKSHRIVIAGAGSLKHAQSPGESETGKSVSPLAAVAGSRDFDSSNHWNSTF